MSYPEHEKLRALEGRSQVVGEFVDQFLAEKGYRICEIAESGRGSFLTPEQQWFPIQQPFQDLLAEFFGLDRAKLDAEKDQMLTKLREGAR